MKLNEIHENAKTLRRQQKTEEFRSWVEERFGREIVPGDVFEIRAPDGNYKRVVTDPVYTWDWNTPAINVDKKDSQGTSGNIGPWPPLGKGKLRQATLM